MLHPAEGRVSTPRAAAAAAKRALVRLARPSGNFDASRYFRGADDLRFHNVGTQTMRALARTIHQANRARWSIRDATAFANTLIADPHLEAKSVGIEVVARYRRDFAPGDLAVYKRWLAGNHSANWATTDAICGALIGPLLVRYPMLAPRMRSWARDRNMWVRRAAAVGLIRSVRRGLAHDLAYEIASTLHEDQEDLTQKAVGWMLREAGKVDQPRLERYLRANGPSIPRTTLRYAIERFPERKRRALLVATRERRTPYAERRTTDRQPYGS
jgi:3-methyladenine DNA glycosylase AlkD